MSRLLAVVAAVAMIAGALYVRGRIDDDEGAGDGGGTERLVCAPELAAACTTTDADVTLEDAGTTAEHLLAPDARAPDAWLTPGPWPAMVDALRSTAGRPPLFEEPAQQLATTRLALVAPPDAPGTWRELGTQVGAGDLRLGWRAPDSGLGVLQVGAFTVGWFGTADVATNDLELDPGFGRYLDAVVAEASVERSPLLTRLQTGRAEIDAALAPEEEAESLLEEAAPRRRGDLQALYPDPVVAVVAVLVGGDDVADDLGEALEDEGWDVPPGPPGLPSAGVLAALWDRVRR